MIQALSTDNTGLVTIPQGITGYSTTSQTNTLIANSLSAYSSTSATNTLISNALNNYTTTSNLASNYVTNSNLSSTLSNLNAVNITNASWCRYQAINNNTAISIPALTSLLVLNSTYTGSITINFDQAISNYCQSGISVFFTGTSPSSWILNNTNGNILFMMQAESNVHTQIHIQWFTMLVFIYNSHFQVIM